jgi:UDP-GlcNAc:undecaprenyl-phosphate GlcNAc-1-phosphate transferase
MRSLLALFLVGAVVTALLTPLTSRLAIRVGAVSTPGGRNVNLRAIPRLGGLAICGAFFAAVAALYASEASAALVLRTDFGRLLGLAIGAVSLCIVGAVDDARRLPALYKVYAQIAAAIIAFAFGYRISAVWLPVVGTLVTGSFALPVTVLWIVGITNAINLIDGLDGLAGGVAFCAALTNLVVAVITGNTFVALAMGALLGAITGFLFFNFNPARIFMGDSGSYFVGFVLGTMSLVGAQIASTAVSLLVPILALGLPIVDTLLSMLRRVLERRSPFDPDRGHIHHRLLDMGFTHKRAVLILYGLCSVFTASAVVVALCRTWAVGMALVAATVAVVVLVRFVGYFDYLLILRRERTRQRSPDAQILLQAIPDVLVQLSTAPTETDALRAMTRMVERGCLVSAEVVTRNPSATHWSWPPKPPVVAPKVVTTRFPLGADALARADLRVDWESASGIVTPQSEVLLQLVADALAKALSRTTSDCAPAPARHGLVGVSESSAVASSPAGGLRSAGPSV